jgi:uncharacterized protein (DUF1778 family)
MRQTAKARRSVQLRFSTDPKIAKQQRELVDKAAKLANRESLNAFILDAVLDAARATIRTNDNAARKGRL